MMNKAKNLTPLQISIIAFLLFLVALFVSLSVVKYFPVVAVIGSMVLIVVLLKNGK